MWGQLPIVEGGSAQRDWSGITEGSIDASTFRTADSPVIVAARDEDFHRWMGPGVPDPKFTACILAESQVVGWVDRAHDGVWLEAGKSTSAITSSPHVEDASTTHSLVPVLPAGQFSAP